MNLGVPAVMASNINLAADSAHTLFDIGKLSAPHREPLAVTEIRFYTGLPTGATVPTGAQSQGRVNLGYELRVSVHVGQYLMVEDAPAWSLGPTTNLNMETIGGVVGCFRWRLSKPLFVPPGMGFRVSARRSLVPAVLSTFATNPLPVWCTVVGQVVESDFPKTMNVPYAAAFDAPPSATAQFTSGQQDLINSTRSDIELKYAIGRLALIYPTTVGGVGPLAETWDVQDAGIDVSAPMILSCGSEIVPAGTEFNAAFDYARRMLRLGGCTLEAGQRMLCWVKNPTGFPSEWTNPGSYYWAPTITIVGGRKENVP